MQTLQCEDSKSFHTENGRSASGFFQSVHLSRYRPGSVEVLRNALSEGGGVRLFFTPRWGRRGGGALCYVTQKFEMHQRYFLAFLLLPITFVYQHRNVIKISVEHQKHRVFCRIALVFSNISKSFLE